MHSVFVICGGIAALVVLVAIASRIGPDRRSSMARATLFFIPAWLIAALVDIYVGVFIAGYTGIWVCKGRGAAVAVLLAFRRSGARGRGPNVCASRFPDVFGAQASTRGV